MKNYLIKLSILMSLALPMSALALQDVTLGSGVIIGTSGGNLTVSGNANPDKIVVDTDTVVATLSNNATLNLVTSSDNTYTITNPTAGATGLEVTVTPVSGGTVTFSQPASANQLTTALASVSSSGGSSSGGSGGGGGGGGGGGVVSSPTPTPTPTPTTPVPEVATVTLPVPAPVAVVVPATPGTTLAVGILLSRQLRYGERSSEVEKLQTALSRDSSIYPEGLKTGLFGPMTRRAVQRFQEKYGIAKSGSLGYGVVGPKTRAKFNEVYGTSSAVPAQTTSISRPSSDTARLALIQSLLKQILALQELLKQLKAAQ